MPICVVSTCRVRGHRSYLVTTLVSICDVDVSLVKHHYCCLRWNWNIKEYCVTTTNSNFVGVCKQAVDMRYRWEEVWLTYSAIQLHLLFYAKWKCKICRFVWLWRYTCCCIQVLNQDIDWETLDLWVQRISFSTTHFLYNPHTIRKSKPIDWMCIIESLPTGDISFAMWTVLNVKCVI